MERNSIEELSEASFIWWVASTAQTRYPAGCKSPTRQSQRYGDGAYSPHPFRSITDFHYNLSSEIALVEEVCIS